MFGSNYFGSSPFGATLAPAGSPQTATAAVAISTSTALDATTWTHTIPTQLPNLGLWLAAFPYWTAGDTLTDVYGTSRWPEWSGHKRDFLAPAGQELVLGELPLVTVASGDGLVHVGVSFFNGTVLQTTSGAGSVLDDFIGGFPSGTVEFTFFVVYSYPSAPSVGAGVFAADSGGNEEGVSLEVTTSSHMDMRVGQGATRLQTDAGVVPINTWQLTVGKYTAATNHHLTRTNLTPKVDQPDPFGGAWDPAQSGAPFVLGAGGAPDDTFGSAYATGDNVAIAELIWFPRALTTTETSQLERYLNAKFGFAAITSDADGAVAAPAPAIHSWTVPLVRPVPVSTWIVPAPNILTDVTAHPAAAISGWMGSDDVLILQGPMDPSTDTHVHPSNLPNLEAWLSDFYPSISPADGFGSGEDITSWRDLSPNRRDFVTDGWSQPVTAVADFASPLPPIAEAAVGYQPPTGHFDAGVPQRLLNTSELGTLSMAADFTVFVVGTLAGNGGALFCIDSGTDFDGAAIIPDATHSHYLFRYGDGDFKRTITIGPNTAGTLALLVVRHEAALGSLQLQTFYNGTTSGTATDAYNRPGNLTPAYLGYDSFQDSYLTGDLGEFVWFSRALATAERQSIERYLAVTYGGISLNGDPDGVTATPAAAIQNWSSPSVTTATPVGVTSTPASAISTQTVPASTVQTGAISVVPSVAVGTWVGPSASTTEALTVNPTPATDAWVMPSSTVVLGNVTGLAPPATSNWVVANSTPSVGGITALPNVASSVWTAAAPTVDSSGASTAAAAITTWNSPTPTIVIGAVSALPSAAASVWSSPSATSDPGAISATPNAASSNWSCPAPITAVGNVTAAPASAVATWTVPAATGSAEQTQAATTFWVVPDCSVGTIVTAEVATNAWTVRTAEAIPPGSYFGGSYFGGDPFGGYPGAATPPVVPTAAQSAWMALDAAGVAGLGSAIASWVVPGPTTVQGAVTAQASPASASWIGNTPTVVFGDTLATPTVAIATWVVPAPTTIWANVVVPPAATNSWSAPASASTQGSTTSIPSVSLSTWSVPALTIVLGGITGLAEVTARTWTVPAADGEIGAAIADVSTRQWLVLVPAYVVGNTTIVANSSHATWVANNASTNEQLTDIPESANATWVVPMAQLAPIATPTSAPATWVALDATTAVGSVAATATTALQVWGSGAALFVAGQLVVFPTAASTAWFVNATGTTVGDASITADPAIQPCVANAPSFTVGPVVAFASPGIRTWLTTTTAAFVGLFGAVVLRATIDAEVHSQPTLADAKLALRPTMDALIRLAETILGRINTRK